MAKLSLQGVRKSFGALAVIKGVDLDIEDGEFVVFVGPSGCGKSTLLRLIAGLEDMSAGTLSIEGRDVSFAPPKDRGIAMVFQSYAIFPHMTVRDNIGFGLTIAGMPKAEKAQKVLAAAKVLKMESLLDRHPSQLSGGQRQRVAIGRAIVKNPTAFLFDEPLSNLDAALRTEMRMELSKLHQTLGATMIYVTHDQVEAMTLADKIVVLNGGEVMQVGTPMDLFHKPQNEFVAGFLGSPKMNFFDGDLVSASNGTGTFSGKGVTVAGARHVSGAAGRPARLGIRPQHLRPDPKGPLAGTVTLIERLGTETVIELVNDQDTAFRCVSQADLKVALGDQVTFDFDPSRAHIFS